MYLVLSFAASAIGAVLGTKSRDTVKSMRVSGTARTFAGMFALGFISMNLMSSFLSSDISSNHVLDSIEDQGGGAIVGTFLNFLNIACLGVLANAKRRSVFVSVVTLNVAHGVLFGAYRSPIIFLLAASLFHFRTHLTIMQAIALSVTGLLALTVLNFKRQGMEVATLIDLGTFARGVFVANNFHDLWTSGVNFDATQLLSRLPLVFVPSAVYPGKGIISFSHLMTEQVYGYVPTIELKPIITFGLMAESWIYLGNCGFLLVGLCTYMYARMIAASAVVSRFLAMYFALKYIMIFRSSVDSFLFTYATNYVLLFGLIVAVKCINHWSSQMSNKHHGRFQVQRQTFGRAMSAPVHE